jgi:hypothetical protein
MALNLDLEVAEVNTILGGLGNLPYGQVEALITKIRNQVIPQLPSQEQAQTQNDQLDAADED